MTSINNVSAGILFFRSVRSSFTSFSLAPIIDGSSTEEISNVEVKEPTLVRIQFFDQVKELRSFFRRTYKLGDVIQIKGGNWEEVNDKTLHTVWVKPRLVINFHSVEEAKLHVVVQKQQHWHMKQCQQWQNRFIIKNGEKGQEKSRENKKEQKIKEKKNESCDCSSHGGGLEKRKQGEIIANFLIHSIMYKLSLSRKNDDYWDGREAPKAHEWSMEFDKERHLTLKNEAIEYLNKGSGVVDVAGGSGHVSMALGLAGVKSTIVDARNSIGKLPGRDRKIWNQPY